MRQSFSVFWWRGSQKHSPSLKLLSLFAGWASLRSTHKSSVPSPALSLCDAAGDNHPVGSWMPHCPRPGLDWAAEPAGPYGLSPKPWTSTPHMVGPPPFFYRDLFSSQLVVGRWWSPWVWFCASFLATVAHCFLWGPQSVLLSCFFFICAGDLWHLWMSFFALHI